MKVVPAEGRSENALLDDKAPGPSRQQATHSGSRGASRHPSLPPSPFRSSSHSLQNSQTDIIKMEDYEELAGLSSATSSRSGSRAHSATRLLSAPLPPNPQEGPANLLDDTLDDLGVHLDHNPRAYTASTCRREAVIDPGAYTLWAQRPDLERLATPSTIIPDTPNRLPSVDRMSDIEVDPYAYWQPLRHRSISPIPSFEEGEVPLCPVLPHLFSRPPSSAGSMESLGSEHTLRTVGSEEDRRFYQNLLGDDDDLGHYKAPPLHHGNFDGPVDENDDKPDDPDDDDDGMLDNEPPLRMNNEPNGEPDAEPDAEPDNPNAHLGAAFEQPHRLRNIYIRT